MTNLKQRGNTLIASLLGILIVLVIGFVALAIWHHRTSHKNTLNSSTLGSRSVSPAQSTSSGTLSSGSDDTSLNNDVNNLNQSLTQNNQNLQTSSSSINDQQLTVPTN